MNKNLAQRLKQPATQKQNNMKQLFFSILAITTLGAFSQNINVSSNIKDVTVFLNGAQIYREAAKTIPAGTNVLVFDDVSPFVQPNSIQLKGKGDFTVLSVSFQNNYMKAKEMSPEVKVLQDSVDAINKRIRMNEMYYSVFEEEKAMLVANRQIRVNDNTIYVEELEDVANLFRRRFADINLKTIELEEEKKDLVEARTKYQNQINELNKGKTKSTGEILVEVSAKSNTTGKFELNYMVNQAGWNPSYDIRVEDLTKPVALDYYAKVWQNSQEDWKNVKLTLSTSTPNANNNKPVMYKWNLGYTQPVSYYNQNYRKAKAMPSMKEEYAPAAAMSIDGFEMDDATTTADYTQFSHTTTNTEYVISTPYNILSNGKENSVHIEKNELKADYKYYAAPKLDKDAFLLAKVTGWSEYNLISGNANIYFEGTYVGNSYINADGTQDTLDISLGRDKSIAIKRYQIKDFNKKSFIGTTAKQTIGYDIEVKNKKPIAIEIEIQDQIPVTTQSDIKIELLEDSKAKYDEEKGFLTWDLKLKPDAKETLTFKYAVTYPKDKQVNLR